MTEIVEVCINLKESENYEYFGTDFLNAQEEKEVEVKTPGWKYKDIVISKPKVYEITKNIDKSSENQGGVLDG